MMKKIAVIEDNDEMRENIAEMLELADYDVVCAENGKVGVELVKKELPDLVICDIMMPELDGYGVLYYLGKNPKTSTIPFVFLSAKAERTDMRKGMSMGADDYITKPFEEIDLLEAIETRLSRSYLFRSMNNSGDSIVDEFLSTTRELPGLESIAQEGRTKSFRKKDQVYFEGDTPNFVYYILEGKVRNYRVNDDGKEFVTDLYTKGDFFGYAELMRSEPYQEYSAAMEDTKLSLISGDDFQKIILSNRDAAANFIKMLAGNVLGKEKDLLDLAYGTVRKRVADSLVKLYDKYSEAEGHFSISISRDELASMVGTATESVIRILSEFKSDKTISVKGSNITILDIESLKNFKF